MSRICYFTRFLPSLERGGGSRRTMQIAGIFENAGIRFISALKGDGMPEDRFRQIEELVGKFDVQTEASRNDISLWSPQRRRGAFRLKEISMEWSNNSGHFEGIPLALVDDPVYFPDLMEHLVKQKIPVIAICHNIESLSRGQVNEGKLMQLLDKEIGILRTADMVITISKEEDWLLNNLGLSSHFFPYFPVDPIQTRMDGIRERRITSEQSGYLMMGTAHNIQTRYGMERLIQFWQENRLEKTFGELWITGFGTETLLPPREPKHGIEILGSLPDLDLDRVLTKTKACICYQESGAGALTRIPELLLAGIPVVANNYAARTHSGTPGVIEFNRLEDLGQTLRTNDISSLQIPRPEPPDPTSLKHKILSFRSNA